MRVVAGALRGRRIEAPPGPATRPTMDRARQATFNALESLGVVDGAEVVDAYAGSGAMGIEALSRGAASCTFIERDRGAIEVLGRNVAALGLAGRSRILRGDPLALLSGCSGATLVIADPPYGFAEWARLLEAVPAGFVVAESDRSLASEVPPIAGWETVRERRYGRATVSFLRRLA